jgi:very-short-patch-repair endonuclease
LVVEADGGSHDDPARDCVRDAWFLRHGWCVLRFTNDEIFDTLDGIVDMIYSALESPHDVMELLNEGKPHRWCVGPH